MYTPKARKLPSGSWQCRPTVNGKTVSVTRKTKSEAERAALRLITQNETNDVSTLTVSQGIDKYIESHPDSLSPSTVRSYRSYQRNRFVEMMNRRIKDVTKQQWQIAIDREKQNVSPKTVRNAWGLIEKVIKEETGKTFDVTLPDWEIPDKGFLTYEEIPKLTEVIKGEPYEIAILLALSSLRVSEILAITRDKVDFEKNCIYVKGAAVLDENCDLVQKRENKNKTSRRTIPFILPQLQEAIERGEYNKGEYLVTFHPNSFHKAVRRYCRQAGLHECTMHDLRRSFLSLCIHLNIPMEIAIRIGGWANDDVARKVYLKISDHDMEAQGKVFSDFFGT